MSLPLKLVQPSIYATALADDKYFTGTRMYLAISAEMNEAELIAKTPNLVKICSASHIEHLVRQALPGIALIHVAQAARLDSREAELSVLQPQSVRRGVGSGGTRAQPGGIRPRGSSFAATGADYSAA